MRVTAMPHKDSGIVEIEHAGAIIQLPSGVIVRNWLDSISGLKDSGVAPARSSHAVPRIGEYWEDQGGYYAGMMRGEDGLPDRYLILPKMQPKLKAEWGCYRKEIAWANNTRYGLQNTAAMAENGSEIAKQVLAMKIEGHSDFYIPARFEAALCYANVQELFEKDWHWTSTQSSAHGAFGQGFYLGCQRTGSKLYEFLVRPVRSFVI